jgi:outer membrane protein TolC
LHRFHQEGPRRHDHNHSTFEKLLSAVRTDYATRVVAVPLDDGRVLNALQNAADSLAALDQDARTLRASQGAVTSAAQVFTDTQARYRLGAVSHPVSSPAKSRWRKAHLSEIQAIADRLVDTTALFQAMGNRAEITTVAETERRTTATGRVSHPVRQRVIAEGC